MPNVILDMLEMRPRWIYLDGKYGQVPMAAFIGIATDEPETCVGIGLREESGRSKFWVLPRPSMMITAWRAMNILDQVTAVKHGTICFAFRAAQRQEDEQVRQALDELRHQLPEIDKLREELLMMPMPEAKLDALLDVCGLLGVEAEVDVRELHDELEKRRIPQTEAVRRVFAVHSAKLFYVHEHSDR